MDYIFIKKYLKILAVIPTDPVHRFIIAFEIGWQQGEILKNIANEYFSSSDIKIEKDLSGKDRYLFIINNH